MKESSRSRQKQSNLFFKLNPNSKEYLIAKIGVDTAKNEPSEVRPACPDPPRTPGSNEQACGRLRLSGDHYPSVRTDAHGRQRNPLECLVGCCVLGVHVAHGGQHETTTTTSHHTAEDHHKGFEREAQINVSMKELI